MQATYCDLCKKRIDGKVTQAVLPRLYTAINPWAETDLCEECVEKLVDFCKEREEKE